ncbi:MAG TPA: ATP12 family protein [Candidatus Sulfotelmatobacter sp.]|jgi:chaperone required for assembly of F1-ATPase|nr:ATP12 family protein [Candidatus Sulfotelmatobacter sp.]
MKRFYKQAAVAAAAEGFAVTLDGRTVKTPEKSPLVLPYAALAEAVAGEWLAQVDEIKPHTMPLTQLASTALDRVAGKRRPVVEHVLNYAGTDLLCYRAESPSDLVARQHGLWQPVLDGVSAALGVEIDVTSGILPIVQPDATMAALRRHVEAYDDWRLTALQAAVAGMGSLFLGLSMIDGRLTAEEAFAASQLDETYQIEFWGDDAEAIKRREALRNDIAAAGRFVELCLPGYPPMQS